MTYTTTIRNRSISFKDSIVEFNQIRNNNFSGNVIIQVPDLPSWMLSFAAGRLSGISGGLDEIDRWKRNLALASLNLPLDRLVKSTNRGEAFSNSNQLAQEWAVREILFDIIQFSQINGDRLSFQLIPIVSDRVRISSTLPILDIKPLLHAAIQSWQEWERKGLTSYSPSLFPIVRKSTQISLGDNYKDFQYLVSSIDGSRSLRSLAIQHQKQLIDVGVAFLPLLKSNSIDLVPLQKYSIEPSHRSNTTIDLRTRSIVPDSAEDLLKTVGSIQLCDESSPLIACIDDSVLVHQHLEKILTERGYRCIGIQDPFKIITTLIKTKPDLIFLDLVMPVNNGYEVCKQIRKTPSLKDIPIIILTGNNGSIDRVRTKFVGANGFLGKPIRAEAVFKEIDKYLQVKSTVKVAERMATNKQVMSLSAEIIQVESIEPAIGSTKRVLVVDDDDNIREVVSMCLKKLKGWDVTTAASGKEGLKIVRDLQPDAILLDVMMPNMDGLTFLQALRSDPANSLIPVVLLTANRYLPLKDLIVELGVVNIIPKPFIPVNLVQQIDRAINGVPLPC
jgi:two-component system, chemotaxis family, response regulator PixG